MGLDLDNLTDPWSLLLHRDNGDPVTRGEVAALLRDGAPLTPAAREFLAELALGKRNFKDSTGHRKSRRPFSARQRAAILAWEIEIELKRSRPKQPGIRGEMPPREQAQVLAGQLFDVSDKMIRKWQRELESYGHPGIDGMIALDRLIEEAQRKTRKDK